MKRLKRNAYKHGYDNQTRHQRKRRRQKPSSSFWSSLAEIQTTKSAKDRIDIHEDWRRFDDDKNYEAVQKKKAFGRVKDQNKDASALEIVSTGDGDTLQKILMHYHEVKQDTIEDLRNLHVKNENKKHQENDSELFKILKDLKRQTQVNLLNILQSFENLCLYVMIYNVFGLLLHNIMILILKFNHSIKMQLGGKIFTLRRSQIIAHFITDLSILSVNCSDLQKSLI